MELVGEFFGTAVLILLGDGVVAGVLLEKSKAKDGGWITITTAWALAVCFGVLVAKALGSPGAHLNPAVTLSVCIQSGDFSNFLPYSLAQIAGAALGATLVYLHYLPHWKETKDAGVILAVFSTSPAIKHTISNGISEGLGTFLLILGIHAIFSPFNGGATGVVGTGFVALLVWAIGLSMGGTTGYAINPARDLGPRIAHWLLPIPNKGNSNWKYAWLPVVIPLVGGGLAAVVIRWGIL
ncbi:MIP/aquaporin family protein [Leptospira bandrabouensis]|uniref:Aquaporin family protein n=1 Tax=Leptospira bandrabouensis TaxID=2484903 RepID=A0A6H3NV22_9LEPT|nr:MIP/aquaporin family protein [Leptospira bandrabouensis]MCG6151131.1 aquaporin family protein [Leptospira bandrabouensis]MCW7457343.1 aquaporin family protein [Leptospira bandrabouensis]MCW7476383.1 aquaporin family protein [Leptospira bandrabouensis]MCW7484066.1 aquaporin family protein [Leptospira bandrabouensis]TGN05076.1 aquaporin family protein [Leptospira bandrabouensis]